MRRAVLAPALEVVAEGADDLLPGLLLGVGGEVAVQAGVVHLLRLGDGFDEGNQFLAQRLEERGHVGSACARLVLFEKCVIGRVFITERLGLLAAEGNETLQVRGEGVEIVVGAGGFPRLFRLAGRLREPSDQSGGDLSRSLVVAPRDAHEGGRVVPRGAVFGRRGQVVQERAHRVAGERLVGEALERRELAAARGGSALGHERLLVPRQDGGGGLKVGRFGEVGFELVERF